MPELGSAETLMQPELGSYKTHVQPELPSAEAHTQTNYSTSGNTHKSASNFNDKL